MTPNSLLSNNNPCSINSAMNKQEYLENLLMERNQSFREGFFKIVGEYRTFHSPIIIETPFGKCSLSVSSLSLGSKPCIVSAINKTEYWLNYAKTRNDKFDNYTYDKTTVNRVDDMLTITCKKHGDFKIKGSNFTSKNQGCNKCFDENRSTICRGNGGWFIEDWLRQATISKDFDSFKFYIIRCWNEDEGFYKIGRTFKTVSKRFQQGNFMPYNYEVVQIKESEDGMMIYALEIAFLEYNKSFTYNPKIKFKGGYTECFSKIIDINNGKEIR